VSKIVRAPQVLVQGTSKGDNNPLLRAKNRTDVWNAEAGSSVRVLLRSLHEAMVHAGRKMAEDPIDKPIHFMVQDRVVDGLLDRAHPEIGNLAARWRAPADAYLGVSTWTATLASLAFVGSLL
jgi:hypothetical protein